MDKMMERVPSPPNDEDLTKKYKAQNKELAAQKALAIIATCTPDDTFAPRAPLKQRLNFIKDSAQHAIQIRLKNLRSLRSRRIPIRDVIEEETDNEDCDELDNEDVQSTDGNELPLETDADIIMSDDDDEDGDEEEIDENETTLDTNDHDSFIENDVFDNDDEELEQQDEYVDSNEEKEKLSSKEQKMKWLNDSLAIQIAPHVKDTNEAAQLIIAYLQKQDFNFVPRIKQAVDKTIPSSQSIV